MKKYTCEECGEEFAKRQLDSESFEEDEYVCKPCSKFLLQAGRDAVDPDHHYSSFQDWDESVN